MVHIFGVAFDTNQPARQTGTIYLKKDFPNVSGIVSCIEENPSMSGLIAFGTYSKNIGMTLMNNLLYSKFLHLNFN